MQLKDYYSILELKPPVSQQEIKKAYRRLAQVYHPDKNQDDVYAQNRFNDIREAYEVLTNPQKRETYHEHRWFFRSQGIKTTGETTTPVSILKQLLTLERRVARIDQFRSGHHPAVFELEHILSKENMEKLNQDNDPEINTEILRSAMRCLKYFPYKAIADLFSQENPVTTHDIYPQLRQYILQRKKAYQWENLRTPLLMLLVIAICLLIYFVSK